MKQTRLLVLVVLAVLALAVLFTKSDALIEKRSSDGIGRPLFDSDDPSGLVVQVAIRGGAYIPATVRVKAGTTVVWKNEDQMPHTVTASDGTWDSGIIQPGGTYSRRFMGEGGFAYYCVPHPEMRGSVVVSSD